MTNFVQTSYSERQGRATAGLIANQRPFDSVTLIALAANIGFGLAISRDASEDKGAVLGGALAAFRGVSIRDITTINESVPDSYKQYQNMGVLTKGVIWVQTATGVDPTDPVYYNSTTGVFANASGSGRVGPLKGARWEETSEAGLGLLDLSGYNQDAA